MRSGSLVAANVGAALDPAGVEALSTLRASAKRDDDPAETVGRFGVGFAAVLAVTDAPSMISRSGGVRWSRDHTVEAIATVPELADELARRQGAVPVLRLPFPAEGDVVPSGPMTQLSSCRCATAQARALVAELLGAARRRASARAARPIGGGRRSRRSPSGLLTAHRAGADTVVVDGGP